MEDNYLLSPYSCIGKKKLLYMNFVFQLGVSVSPLAERNPHKPREVQALLWQEILQFQKSTL